MRPDVEASFAWQRAFIPHMKEIAGRHLIGEAPAYEDARHNTDLIVLKLDAVRIACRVRRASYRERYGNEFTIRATRPSGTQTELAKILEGWGDYVLYGFEGTEDRLSAWMLGDLRIFRLWFVRYLAAHQGNTPGQERANGDGSSRFRSFQVSDLPDDFIVARSLS